VCTYVRSLNLSPEDEARLSPRRRRRGPARLFRGGHDKRLIGFGWQDSWDNFTGPQAKAFHLLKKLDLGPAGSRLRQAGEIIFEEFGGAPCNSYTWVELKEDLTVSLLQARRSM
jgi:hypothetical protein